MTRTTYVDSYGGIFEHSPWIAEQAFDDGLTDACDTAEGLHALMTEQFRNAPKNARHGVLIAHPDLAGKLAEAKRLTVESTAEQASAGLDALTDDERSRFTDLNHTYVDRFGFPFIIAVKGLTKSFILSEFERRLDHAVDAEFDTACQQVEKIALLRLKDLLP